MPNNEILPRFTKITVNGRNIDLFYKAYKFAALVCSDDVKVDRGVFEDGEDAGHIRSGQLP